MTLKKYAVYRAARPYEDTRTGPNQVLRPIKVPRTGPNQFFDISLFLVANRIVQTVFVIETKGGCFSRGPFTNYVMHFLLVFYYQNTHSYVFAIIFLNIYIIKFICC